ncbi:MAG: energy transducer TonB [Candidatus Omnitrophica bacterium]|nr:energy transducer TonB [Candidatus Omnitrophota bacterium]
MKRFLAMSLLGHALFAGAGSVGFHSRPEFAVKEAPSSVEVDLIEEKETEIRAPEEEMAAVKDPPKEEKKPEKILVRRGAVREARPGVLANPAPVYPELARRRGWEGLVVLKVLVEKEGLASKTLVKKSSGHTVLDRAALETVRLWRFSPARFGDMVFSSWVEVPVRFVLRR